MTMTDKLPRLNSTINVTVSLRANGPDMVYIVQTWEDAEAKHEVWVEMTVELLGQVAEYAVREEMGGNDDG